MKTDRRYWTLRAKNRSTGCIKIEGIFPYYRCYGLAYAEGHFTGLNHMPFAREILHTIISKGGFSTLDIRQRRAVHRLMREWSKNKAA